uniref:Mucin 15, cell surface associated n=1 Tax=Poecilia latipinna TaxID=48699 RepID=A0A3B3U1I5_9TELE
KMKPLKITASLLLLLQAFHLVCLQNSTDSPGRTIDKAWLRQLPRNEVQSENAASSGDGGFDQGTDQVTAFNNGLSSGIPSGFMAEEEENMTSQDKTSANSSQTNMTNPEEEFNSTTTADNTTNAGGLSNNTNLQSTTTTVKPATTTVTPEKDKGLRNLTENTNTSATTTAAPEINRSTTTTTAAPEINRSTTTTTAAPEIKGSTTKSSTTTEPPSETTQTTSETTTTAFSANKKIAIAVVGLVAYIIMKKKHQKAFTHRKLVEEYPSDPVLRLDNGEPLDLNYGSSAYYNPGLQGDSIQMTNIPGRR